MATTATPEGFGRHDVALLNYKERVIFARSTGGAPSR